MDFLPQKDQGFGKKIRDNPPGQDSISDRRMAFKINRWIEIPNIKPDFKTCATYNKANKSHLFVTVFANVPAAKKITAGTCTLIPANALYRHPAQKMKRIEHFNGHRCTNGFKYNYQCDKFARTIKFVP